MRQKISARPVMNSSSLFAAFAAASSGSGTSSVGNAVATTNSTNASSSSSTCVGGSTNNNNSNTSTSNSPSGSPSLGFGLAGLGNVTITPVVPPVTHPVCKEDPPDSPPPSPGCPPGSPEPCTTIPMSLPMSLPMAVSMANSIVTGNVGSSNSSSSALTLAAQQQQQLRALATGLSTAMAAVASQNNSSSIDDLLVTEVTQRLLKMNQELWQQGVAAAVASSNNEVSKSATSSTMTAPTSSGSGVPNTSCSTNTSSSINTSSATGGHTDANTNSSSSALLNELNLNTLNGANEIKLAEDIINKLALQIFMHKSAMQLQQQQQQAAAVQQAQNHHLGQHGQLIRAGSSSGSESGALSKPHQCQQCLKAFSSNHQLVQHIRVHTGEKPYKCSYCDRRFKQLSHVQQHTRLHTGERPYKCHLPECGRAFIQLSNLQQHLRNHDAQLERSKNRPFHCNICGKGFATESSLRTHTSKVCKDQHTGLIGGPNLVTCPICHKPFYGGEALMDHMKHTHKDPNASGVATKRRTANHPCPVCGKHYVNEGSLRKHLTCHPETAQLGSSLRMWPCPVCQAVFTHENGLLTHMEQMRMDPKHQFAAQYTLSRAAAERRERENILAAAAVAAMAQAGGHHFAGNQQNQGLQHGSLGTMLPMPPSPSGSESSGRLSSPLDTNAPGMSHPSVLHHSRMNMSSPVGNGPLELTRGHHPNSNGGDGRSKDYDVGMSGHNTSGDSSNNAGGRDDHHSNSHHPAHLPPPPSHHHPGSHGVIAGENGMVKPTNQLQDAMKMAAMLSQGGPNGQTNIVPNEVRNIIHHPNEMMSPEVRMQTEAILRTQAEALRLAIENHTSSNNNNNNAKGNNNSHSNQNGGSSPNSANNNNNSSNSGHNGPNGEIMGNQMSSMISQHAQPGHHPTPAGNHSVSNGHGGHHRIPDHHRLDAGLGQPGNLPHSMANPHHLHHSHPALNHHPHQLNSILSQQSDLSEALMRLDARTLGFPLPAHNS